MKEYFDLRQIVVDTANEKVSKFLDAKLHISENYQKEFGKRKQVFTGQRLAYAVLILNLVVKQFDLNIKLDDIIQASKEFKGHLSPQKLKLAEKNIGKIFKSWTRQALRPQNKITQLTDKLNYPSEL